MVVISSLLPDIDDPRSRIGNLIMPLVPAWLRPAMFLIVGAFFVYLYLVHEQPWLFGVIGGVLIACSLIKHRKNPTHALVGLVLVALCLYYQRPEMVIPAAIGYGTHLVLDILTEGVPLFWPSMVWIRAQITNTEPRLEQMLFYRGAQVLMIWMLLHAYGSQLIL